MASRRKQRCPISSEQRNRLANDAAEEHRRLRAEAATRLGSTDNGRADGREPESERKRRHVAIVHRYAADDRFYTCVYYGRHRDRGRSDAPVVFDPSSCAIRVTPFDEVVVPVVDLDGVADEDKEEDEQDHDFTCGICLVNRSPLADRCRIRACGHVYCRACLRRWMERRTTCPACRGQVVRRKNPARVGRSSGGVTDP